MPTKIIANCETGEVTEVELTAEELRQLNADIAASETQRQAEEEAATKKAADRSSGKAKLAALGLSADEIAALVE
tara:strand:- start:561 stop:785 length:225 start_codon:yes stop_codon:yes gene_type:complete